MAINHVYLFLRVRLAEFSMEFVDDSIAIEKESQIEFHFFKSFTCFISKVESWQLWASKLPHANHDQDSREKLLLQGPSDSFDAS